MPRNTPVTQQQRGHEQKTTFTFGSGRTYGNNDEYVTKGFVFKILAVEFEEGAGFDGKDRWAITVQVGGRAGEVLTFSSNPKRDELMRGAQKHLADGHSLGDVSLRKVGNAYYFADKRP